MDIATAGVPGRAIAEARVAALLRPGRQRRSSEGGLDGRAARATAGFSGPPPLHPEDGRGLLLAPGAHAHGAAQETRGVRRGPRLRRALGSAVALSRAGQAEEQGQRQRQGTRQGKRRAPVVRRRKCSDEVKRR